MSSILSESGFGLEGEKSDIPASLVHLLRTRAQNEPETIVHTFLPDGINPGPYRSFAGIDHNARAVAAALNEHGSTDARALLLYAPGLEFIDAFFGCLYAGTVAAPAFPPDPSRIEQTIARLQSLAYDSQARFVLTTTPILHLLRPAVQNDPILSRLTWIATDQIALGAADTWKEHLPKPDELAYFQYTSGSTRTPHGVCLTHGNLVHNSARIGRMFEVSKSDITVNWLPMYHNLGLIGCILQPFFVSVTSYLMSPQTFLQNPLIWLQAITHYKATISGAPNFAFDLCVHRIPPEKREGLDLSSWELAFSGGEPVRPETLDRFAAAFGPYGFRRKAFYPCYGLAESTLMVTGGKRFSGPTLYHVEKTALEKNQVRAAAENASDAVPLIGCGGSLVDHRLVIVDPETQTALPEDQVGEIWLQGPSISPGYWNHPEETAATFQSYLSDGQGPFMRTGDLGFLHNGECFITGRLKDLIIIHGRNLYPQDIERTVESSHPALIPTSSAAFSIEDGGEEKLVVVQEVNPQAKPDFAQVVAAARRAVSQAHAVQLYSLVLVEPASVPKTVSGKVQRQLARKMYLESKHKVIHQDTLAPQAKETVSESPAAAGGSPAMPGNLLHAALQALGPDKAQDLLAAYIKARIAQILKVPEAAIDSSQPLVTLGMDSISSIELAQDIESAIGVQIPLVELVKGASLADLVRMITEALHQKSQLVPAPAAVKLPEEQAAPVDQPEEQPAYEDHPLSYGQRALWFVQQLNPESIAHNIVYGINIFNELDLEAFRRTLEKLVQRHAVLRARFVEVDGQPVQRIYSNEKDFSFIVEDASSWSEEQIEDRKSREVYTPFNLETGPIMRVTVLKKAAQEYTVILALHHIVTDLWSLAILLHELGEIYTAEVQGGAPNLRPVSAAYTDTVQWQLEMLASPKGEEHLAYWKERLSGELPSINLPTDHPRPAELTGRGGAMTVHLGPELTQALKALANQFDSNLFSTLLSAYYTLLYRYTGQTDLLVGSPKAGRSRKNALTFGYFINPVILRASLDGEMAFSSLMQQVYRNTQADFQHDEYPFPLLVEKLHPHRETGNSGLMQVLFSWQKTHRMMDNRIIYALASNEESYRFNTGMLSVSALSFRARVSPTDLALLVTESEDDLALTIEYSADLFEPQTVERLTGHLITILNSVTTQPDLPLSRIPMLTEPERKQLLVIWNASAELRAETYLPVHLWIEEQASLTPNAVAIEAGDQQITYRDMVKRVQSLAAALCAAGIGRGKIVGMFAERSIELVIGLLATLKAGGAYLPLDPEFPPERLAFMIEDSGASALLTQSWLVERLPEIDIPRICLDGDVMNTAADCDQCFPFIHPEDTAYIMYTSGSTGQPKGVMVPHGSISRHCRFMQKYYAHGPEDRILQFSSLNFDPSLEQIFTALMSGARLVLRSNTLWDPAVFSQKIADLRLTVVNIPPPYWTQWVNADIKAEKKVENPQLRLVIIGGDVVLPETLRQWLTLPMRSARLLNAYGPTEATITAAAFDIPPQAAGWARIPIGRPLGGRKAYILDAEKQPVPVGVPGELYIGGSCLAAGYLNQPELTAEKFIPDPFDPSGKGKLYRTGDLARYLPDGNIEFLGRIDRQFKVLGVRIEPGEIEAQLKSHPDVADAVVLNITKPSARLVSCIIPRGSATPQPEDLTIYLARRLPQYMIPANFLAFDAFPLTPNGKLDRDTLVKDCEERLEDSNAGYVAPRNEIEEYLASLWAELLGVERVGIYDNFFALGGHSLLATQLIARVRDEFQVELPLRQLFESPTIANVSVAIVQSLASSEDLEDLEELIGDIESGNA